jgi:hypothetical protein
MRAAAAAIGLVLFVVVCLSAGFACAAQAEAGGQATASDYELPAEVIALFETADDGGVRIVGEELRAYFDALPDHAKRLAATAIVDEYITSSLQLRAILELKLTPQRVEALLSNNCVLCHSNPDFHDPETLFSLDPVEAGSPSHLNLRDVVGDVHFRHNLSCAGCHGGDPTGFMAHDFPDSWPDADERAKDRTWVPEFCGRCHADTAYMQKFAPGMPTDQLAKYKTSPHGKRLLEEKDSRAAECVSCHGVHGILPADSPRSSVYPKRIVETCGACHSDTDTMKGMLGADGLPLPTDQLALYKTSVHGRALLERGDIGAPACNDCHGNHAAIPPGVASVAQICRTCHAGNGSLFDGSRHKQKFDEHGWPECGACHGNHAIQKTSDALLGGEESLCADCHAQWAQDNPECEATAAYFHESLTGLAASHGALSLARDDLAERGLDVEPIEVAFDNLTDALSKSRSYIHTFDRSDFDQALEPGRTAVEVARVAIADAHVEYAWRRRGLLVAIGWMVMLGVVLYLKLRRLERDQEGREEE